MTNKIFLVAVFSILYVGVNAANVEQCPPTPKHYAELDCKPIIEKGQTCPSRFECPTITDVDGQKCHYAGKTYSINERLPEEKTSVLCATSCICANNTKPATFICADIECAHYFFPQKPECKHLYSSNSCCPSKTECNPVEIKKLATCQFDNKNFLAGQKMYPEAKEHECYTCLCTDNFDNSTVVGNPNCYDAVCDIQLRNFGKLDKGCIPVYFDTTRCCPVGWRCPSEEDDTITPFLLNEAASEDEKMTCKFGNKTMRIGDTLASVNKCEVCTCFPPMAHCIQDRKCSNTDFSVNA